MRVRLRQGRQVTWGTGTVPGPSLPPAFAEGKLHGGLRKPSSRVFETDFVPRDQISCCLSGPVGSEGVFKKGMEDARISRCYAHEG
jgi:hypothetical protein